MDAEALGGPAREEIRAASRRLAGVARRTPLLVSHSVDERAGAAIRLKAEHLQRTGSFKVRGAANALAILVEAGTRAVVTASSGNHGQAVAFAARTLGVSARVVVPTTANPLKVAAIEGYGARVEYAGTTSQDRLERAQEIARSAGIPFVPPYDDVAVMAGQATIGLEILGDFAEVETVLVPIGGGGLIAGIASAIKMTAPRVRVIGVEPEGAPKASRSKSAGRRVVLAATETVADGLKALALGERTWPLIDALVDDVVTVSDAEILDTVRFLALRTKQVVEPSGATALAFTLRPSRPVAGQRVAVVLSGGNVDPALFGGPV